MCGLRLKYIYQQVSPPAFRKVLEIQEETLRTQDEKHGCGSWSFVSEIRTEKTSLSSPLAHRGFTQLTRLTGSSDSFRLTPAHVFTCSPAHRPGSPSSRGSSVSPAHRRLFQGHEKNSPCLMECAHGQNIQILSRRHLLDEVNAHSAFNWVRELTRTTDKERHEICWDPFSARGNFQLYLEEHCQYPNENHCRSERYQGHSGGAVQPNIFTQDKTSE